MVCRCGLFGCRFRPAVASQEPAPQWQSPRLTMSDGGGVNRRRPPGKSAFAGLAPMGCRPMRSQASAVPGRRPDCARQLRMSARNYKIGWAFSRTRFRVYLIHGYKSSWWKRPHARVTPGRCGCRHRIPADGWQSSLARKHLSYCILKIARCKAVP